MENGNFKTMWTDKYRPSRLDDYVLDPGIKDYFRQMIANKAPQNCTFAGIAGSGKTTLARLLANEFGAEVLFVKCSTEGTVDVIRSKIEPFCNALSFDGRVKMVVLDEIDSASSGGGNSFQMALRTLIEGAQDDTRFVLTCNFQNKVIPALLSRCPIIPLRYGKSELLRHVTRILDAEKVRYGKESLRRFIEESFGFYPDCRRIVGYLQMCCNSGELVARLGQSGGGEDGFLAEFAGKIRGCRDLMALRSFYLGNKSKIQDYRTFAGELYDYALDEGLASTAEDVLRMSDLIYQMNLVVNPEIQFFALACLVARMSGKGAAA